MIVPQKNSLDVHYINALSGIPMTVQSLFHRLEKVLIRIVEHVNIRFSLCVGAVSSLYTLKC